MATVTIAEAQANLPEIVENLKPGEEVVITSNQQPIAKLIPFSAARPQPVFGSCRGKLVIVTEDEEHSRSSKTICHEAVAGRPRLPEDGGGTAMIRGFCLAVDQETGRICGAGLATYIDLQRGCTVCAKHYWEAEARRRKRQAGEVPESAGDRVAVRVYGGNHSSGGTLLERTESMSEWQTHNVEQEIMRILGAQQAVHHFGPPYLTAYQLAAEFRRRNPNFMPHLPVGGEGTGVATGRESLARYLSRELSQRIRDGRIIAIEGAMLSNDHLHDISFLVDGQVVHSTLTGSPYTLSMFRVRDGAGEE